MNEKSVCGNILKITFVQKAIRPKAPCGNDCVVCFESVLEKREKRTKTIVGKK